jgi:hypothetical protein
VIRPLKQLLEYSLWCFSGEFSIAAHFLAAGKEKAAEAAESLIFNILFYRYRYSRQGPQGLIFAVYTFPASARQDFPPVRDRS